VYYWATSLRGTFRAPADADKAVPFIVPNSATNARRCSGCHSVSRDGKIIAFSAGEAAVAELQVAPTETPWTPTIAASGTHDSTMPALNADGTRVLVSVGYQLVLRDTESGQILTTVNPTFYGAGKSAFHPEWSPDGQNIAVTLSSTPPLAEWTVTSGDIAVIPYNNGNFGPARIVVPSTERDFHFYPSWSPDGRFILFASAPIGSAGGSYDQPNARLRLVSSEGGNVHELANATQGIGKTSTLPKFAPFVQRNGKLLFFTYNSKIDYGFLLKNSQLAAVEKAPQIWLAALDLDRLSESDPSYPPVWLPIQDVTQSNHLAYWAEKIPCTGQSCVTGQACVQEACIVVR
jgi:Tol biopolymer transport system component